ncbi:hypothetical protein [Actinoplanes sp. NBRC 101535]|uniref:hypothetical protein n=1 Tax=Actinoplanes sp. NBRC 101535 TaxID=3032196 RepID=UPI002554C8D8|nr:hypothetical protein [Actinoplanes sp. NBRC 101535]
MVTSPSTAATRHADRTAPTWPNEATVDGSSGGAQHDAPRRARAVISASAAANPSSGNP